MSRRILSQRDVVQQDDEGTVRSITTVGMTGIGQRRYERNRNFSASKV